MYIYNMITLKKSHSALFFLFCASYFFFFSFFLLLSFFSFYCQMNEETRQTNNNNNRYWCHICNAEVQIYMAPDPTCQRCNEQFIEEV